MTKPPKKRQKGDSNSRKLKAQGIVQQSMTGRKTSEIAESYGMSRQAVSKILNSDEVKALVKLGEMRLQGLMTKAIDVLEWTMDHKDDFGVTGAASQNAKSILKSLGVLKEKVDVSHTFPKPTVVEYSDGTTLVLGTDAEEQ